MEKYDGYLAAEVTTNTFDEYRPKKADTHLFKKAGPLIYPQELKISNYFQNTFQTSFNLEATQSGTVSLGQFAFPGQTLYLNGIKSDYQTNDSGLITFPLEAGAHSVRVIFENTSLINFSKLLSLIGLSLIALIVIYQRKKKSR